MIEFVPADGHYGQPATPGWREIDWGTHERDAIVAGRRLRYVDVGSGPRCVLLIHGLGGRWQHWLETIPALAEHRRVIAIDLPGFGHSERPAAGSSLDGFADTAAALTRQLAIERVVVAGHSMGGPIAIRFASRHPELTEAVVPVAGAILQFSALLGLSDVMRFAARRPRETAAIVAEIATAGLPAPGPLRQAVVDWPWMRRLFLSPYMLRPLALPDAAVRLVVDGAGAPGVLPAVRAIGRSDPREGLAAVRCPILSLAADQDRIAPLSDTEAFDREVARGRTVVLRDCGHMLMLERPQAFNRQLIDFTEGLP